MKLESAFLTLISVSTFGCAIDARPALSGGWVAQGYTCGGLVVPDEQVTITDTGDQVTAVKTLGDDCVTTGKITWQGTYDATPFDVEVTVWDNGVLELIPGQVTVVNADELELVSTGGLEPIVYARQP